jgi:hypothetical protein
MTTDSFQEFSTALHAMLTARVTAQCYATRSMIRPSTVLHCTPGRRAGPHPNAAVGARGRY